MFKPPKPKLGRGATGVSYGLVVGLIAIIALASIQGIGSNVVELFDEVSDTTGTVAANHGQAQATPTGTPLNVNSATCQTVLDTGGSTGDGVYSLTGTGLGNHDAFCDMSTDGGGWMLVMNYVKPSTQTSLSANPAAVPPLMNPASTLGDYDATNWGHLNAAGVSTLDSNGFTEFRIYCTADTLSSGDPMPTVHIKVSPAACLYDHFGGNNVNGTSTCIQSDGTSLAGDTSNMGSAVWAQEYWNYSDQGADYAMTSYPWWPYEQGDTYWTAFAVDDTSSSRWDCTDGQQGNSSSYNDSNGGEAHYIHRMWVR